MTSSSTPSARMGHETGASLHRRIIFATGVIATLLVGLLAFGSLVWISRLLDGQAEAFRSACYAILGSACALLTVILAALAFVSRLLARRVSQPAAELASVAERVAVGDLAQRVAASDADDELGRLSRATEAMVVELRRLVTAIRDSAAASAAMAVQITANGQQMSAAAAEMARTSGDLSQQSSEMAHTIANAAADATSLLQIAARLTQGVQQGIDRNRELRDLARQNRERLDESAEALRGLAADARSSAEAADALAGASEEIRGFVTLVRKVARQSKLLALNAAMEAARAGEEAGTGARGFGVVASEIRKLAISATEAAQRAEQTVNEVLVRVQASRASSQRTLDTAASLGGTTEQAMRSFAEVEHAVADAETWTASIAVAAAESSELVGRVTGRLDELARGTESFAAAMQQVAASTQQQSASTEQIAATAAAMASAARDLRELVATFRLEAAAGSAIAAEPPPADPFSRAALAPA